MPRKPPVSDKAARENEAYKDFHSKVDELTKNTRVETVTPAEVATVSAWDFFDDDEPWQDAWEEIWQPEPGETLEGILVARSVFEGGDFNEVCQRYVVLNRAGERISFVGGQVFDANADEKEIDLGYRLRITYKGKKEIKGGKQTMNQWRIQYKPPTFGNASKG